MALRLYYFQLSLSELFFFSILNYSFYRKPFDFYKMLLRTVISFTSYKLTCIDGETVNATTQHLGLALGDTLSSPTSICHEPEQSRTYRLEAEWISPLMETRFKSICLWVGVSGQDCNVCVYLFIEDNQTVCSHFQQRLAHVSCS